MDTPTESPFAHFTPGTPAPQTQQPAVQPSGKKPKAAKKRGPRRVVAMPNTPAVKPAPRPRKPKGEKKPRKAKAARGLKIDVAKLLPAVAGLKAADSAAVLAVQQVLEGLNKRSRARVLDALNKIHSA